jgi:hypothetical protein
MAVHAASLPLLAIAPAHTGASACFATNQEPGPNFESRIPNPDR